MMGWIAFLLLTLAIGTCATVSVARSGASRRSGKLESAFIRARGQRMVANGIRTFR